MSPSSEFARWWGDGLQSNFRAYCSARLEDIVRYIAADDPAVAKSFAMRLLERADLLSEFPELGTPYRKRKKCPTPAVRSLFHLLSHTPRKPSDPSDGFLAFSSNGTEPLICFGSGRSFDRSRVAGSEAAKEARRRSGGA